MVTFIGYKNKAYILEQSNYIYLKLEIFIKKFYTNELIRGIIFFVGLGLLYLLFTLFVEYFLWLKPAGRMLLFWTFISVELFLLVRFILFPIFKLLKLQKGINYNQASAIIGSHFAEVSDKLTNFLQLSNDKNQSELLLASIEQKANSLQPIPFGNAINFNSNRKYLPLAIIPILFLIFFFLSGNSTVISQSFNRVVHFNSSFSPPAPFQFVILNSNLQTEQNKDFVLRVKSEGKIVPENAVIFIGKERYFMENVKAGEFQFKIDKPIANINFHLEANSVTSLEYELKVVRVPSIANFEMVLNFPVYLNKKAVRINGNGNAVIPEGTRVTWKITTQATQNVVWKEIQQQFSFSKQVDYFVFSKYISQNTEYQILTSNEKVKNYEKLNFQLSVIKDQFPTIQVEHAPDSLKAAKSYVLGKISDDYGLSKLRIVYYPTNSPKALKLGVIKIIPTVYDRFVFSFPGSLPVEQGVSYEYYFEVFDNDAPHHFKSTKSSVFSSRVATDEEREALILQQQNENINSLEKALKNQDKQISDIEKLQKTAKEKHNFEFKDQQKVNDFLNRQIKQDEMMKEFSHKTKENLDKFKANEKDLKKDELEKRLENANIDLDKNKKLLDELKDLNDKINTEELSDKLDKFKQNSKNQTKNLEQLVELTKRFYVEKKTEQLADRLMQLSKNQDNLSNNEKENKLEKQEEINSSFDKILNELNELQQENNKLKVPMDIPKDTTKEKNIVEDLNKAKDELQKNNKDKAKPSQKRASKNMKEMSMKMEQSMEGSDKEQLEEDVKMLRQILDNLLAFSLSQEDLMGQFKNLKLGSPAFNKYIKIQQNLKQQFKHVDDSLFSVSLRNPKIAEDVTKEIGNVHYNIDKSLETLSDARTQKGLSHQQYVISSANKLADLLSDILNNMQMSMSSMGQGKPKPGSGQGMQLPDIIKKQEGIGDKIKEGMKKGQKPGEAKQAGKEGEKSKDGNSGQKPGGSEGEYGEGEAKAIMEIYKEQKQLREALQNELDRLGLDKNGQNSIEQMKQIEKQLLNRGFKNETLQKALNVNQELLKLKTAVQQQGEENKRQSITNKKEFYNQHNALPASLLDYLNSIEILNRQSLPLRSNFNQRVQEYFNTK